MENSVGRLGFTGADELRLVELIVQGPSPEEIGLSPDVDEEFSNLVAKLKLEIESNPSSVIELAKNLAKHENEHVRVQGFVMAQALMYRGQADREILSLQGQLLSEGSVLLWQKLARNLAEQSVRFVINHYGASGLLLVLGGEPLTDTEDDETANSAVAFTQLLEHIAGLPDTAEVTMVEGELHDYMSGEFVRDHLRPYDFNEDRPQEAHALLVAMAEHDNPMIRETAAYALRSAYPVNSVTARAMMEKLSVNPSQKIHEETTNSISLIGWASLGRS